MCVRLKLLWLKKQTPIGSLTEQKL